MYNEKKNGDDYDDDDDHDVNDDDNNNKIFKDTCSTLKSCTFILSWERTGWEEIIYT